MAAAAPAAAPAPAAARQGNRYRGWCGTINNWTAAELATLRTSPDYEYLIIGQEGRQPGQTPHLQLYIEMTVAKRLTQMVAWFPRAHWEPRRGTAEQARDYCKKEGQYEEHGELSTERSKKKGAEVWRQTAEKIQGHESWNGVLNDFSIASVVACRLAWAKQVWDARPRQTPDLDMDRPGYTWQGKWRRFLLETEADDRTVHVLVNPAGNLGKSRWAKQMFLAHKAMLMAGDSKSNASLWGGQGVIILDVARSGRDPDWESIECLKNGCIINTKYEVVAKVGQIPHIVILTNKYPDTTKLSMDRWNIVDRFGDDMGMRDFFPEHRFPAVLQFYGMAVPVAQANPAPARRVRRRMDILALADAARLPVLALEDGVP